MRLLISGVPGAGKTTVAGHLARHLGCPHVDMEKDDWAARHQMTLDREAFLSALPVDVVVSWGFGPFAERAHIGDLIAAGFTLIWLDGDRVASFREYMRRENNNPVRECAYYVQMQMVVATEIIMRVDIVVNPFDGDGQFLPVPDVAEKILYSAQLKENM